MKRKILTNITEQKYQVSRALRNKLNKHASFVIWFTGLSGSGKSTLANGLEKMLYEKGYKSYVLDGDNIRNGICSDLDFTEQGRKENIRRVAEIAKLMADAGLIVITSFISPYRADRRLAKGIIGNDSFVEVYVDCPLDVCEKRDTKGLYTKARSGKIKHFTGIDSPYQKPLNPAIVVHTDTADMKDCLKNIFKTIEKKIKA